MLSSKIINLEIITEENDINEKFTNYFMSFKLLILHACIIVKENEKIFFLLSLVRSFITLSVIIAILQSVAINPFFTIYK